MSKMGSDDNGRRRTLMRCGDLYHPWGTPIPADALPGTESYDDYVLRTNQGIAEGREKSDQEDRIKYDA